MPFDGDNVSFNMELKWNYTPVNGISFSTELLNHAYRLTLLRNFSA